MVDFDTSSPGDSDIVSQFPANERAARAAVVTAFGIDHHTTNDGNQGRHVKVSLIEGTAPSTAASVIAIYAKDVSGQPELFMREESDGDEVQITSGGSLNVTATNAQEKIAVGDIIIRFDATPRTGFLLLAGQTMGSAASGATAASDDYEDLFLHLWAATGNDEVAVSGGRGVSAAADWAANKTMTLPSSPGNSLIGAGTGTGGLTVRTTADTGGAETHTLTVDEMPSHTHRIPVTAESGGGGSQQRVSGSFSPLTEATGGDQPHNNMPPWLAVYFFIRY